MANDPGNPDPYRRKAGFDIYGNPLPKSGSTPEDPLLNSDAMTGTKTLNNVVESQKQYFDSTYGAANKRIQQIASGRNAGEVLSDVSNATVQGGQASDNAAGSAARQSAGLGLPGMSASSVKQMGLRRVLAQVDSGNRTAQAAVQRQQAAQDYSSAATANYGGEATSILGSIARNEADRQAQYMDAKANAEANTMGLMGQAGGLIIAALA